MSDWIDLTVLIKKTNLTFPGDEQLEITKVKSLSEDGYNLNQLYLNMHLGTHIDFKNHVSVKEEEIDFNDFLGKANVIRPKIIDSIVSTDDLRNKYEELLYKERILILDLHNAQKFNTKAYFEPIYFEPSIYSFLREYNISLFGADIPTFMYKNENDLKMHRECLKNGIRLIENLTNLHQLTSHVYFLGLPLSIDGIEASLIRAVAKNI
jgi:kynurenine formamidase